MIRALLLPSAGPGLHEITREVCEQVSAAGFEEGLCTLFLQHTSASLIVQENADPTARADLERWLDRLVPEGDPLFRHMAEGPDDMPAHVKAALTATSLSIPIVDGNLALGTWQGIFLWEHRREPRPRRLLIHLGR
ncbi:MAG TPA: secondary thiamine-phosphate synthase enzyme YjbQ [Thermoanaerobaculia bacterium]|nr:secondary thiamine-phosphate synthase enzyme YjbQ [Thermoanaerobaculia bacterium]